VLNGVGAVATGTSTCVFLFAKFTKGAWVVVVAIPMFIGLFHLIERYYRRTAHELGLGQIPEHPRPKPVLVIVPVVNVSKLTAQAISEALSIGDEVVAVTVVFDDSEPKGPCQTEWEQWNVGVPLRVLHTEYASIVRPVIEFVDEMRSDHADYQIVVLIPVVIPRRLFQRILHNQLDVALSAALRTRTDLVVARVSLSLDELAST